MIKVTHLTKQYNKTTVLDDVSFTIAKGSLVGIVGSNGAGKSTLISIMASIIKPTKGDVLIDSGPIAYVPQEITLFPNLTVKENLDFWAILSTNHTRKERRQNIEALVQVTKLQDYLNQKVSKLSGGLQRRLNIAVALLANPNILIMDEPTVGIDISSRSEIISFIKNLSAQGTTIIYVSHHPDEIEQLCDHLLCLNKGQLVFNGTLDQLKNQYPQDNIYTMILKISQATKESLGQGEQE